KKVVTISYQRENLAENISVLGKTYEIKYSIWDYLKSDNSSCRFRDNQKTIEINQSYPLFKSKSQGAVFKKISILLLVASHSNRTAKEMFKNIDDNFLTEFKDFL